jgi:hypothetical protein
MLAIACACAWPKPAWLNTSMLSEWTSSRVSLTDALIRDITILCFKLWILDTIVTIANISATHKTKILAYEKL